MRPRPTEISPVFLALRGARLVVIACAALVPPPTGAAATGIVVPDLRPLLVAAIDAQDGRATGTLDGPVAEALRHRAVSEAPLLVEVTTLRTYREPGCKRLNVRFEQRAVKLGDAPPADRTAAFQLDYCRNGQPPRSRE